MMSGYKVPEMLRQSIKLFFYKLWLKLIGPCMHYHSSSITPIKYKSEKLSKFRQLSFIHAITSVGQTVRSEKNLSEISIKSVRFFLSAVFCRTK